ncbi:MAG: glycosyltransferase [Armatimonadetes bacterium]|nr:glycosyltransferase [Armatimonadota bacterium]NIM23140.1 glycosyltransferase [Armatimonadota bacterium]NIM67008.1 glycosyltransferase [Armatimonadota bacterium]NIM75542.1 glycosyltransferase [Armatimonadota bacterium]NIN05197.1 glycosyltransferase [Armatimonadota bacterium]
MRIALFSECYSPIVNGVVVAVSTLRQELLRLGHQVYLFAPRYPGYQETEPNIFRFPSISLPTNPRYPLGIPLFSRDLSTHLRDFAPEVVHSHSLFGMGRAAKKAAHRQQARLVFTYHTLLEDYSHYVPLPQPLVRWLARRVSRSFADRADFIIAPGPAAQQALRSYGVVNPVEIIPTGADLSLAEESFSSPIRQRWGIPEEAPLVAFAGRIAKEKNLELLLTAFKEILSRLPAAHLLLIGGGPWEDEIQRLASRLNLSKAVHISGFLPRREVFHALKHAQLFAFPSLTDTQGIVVIEAMACGLPVVATESGAVAEILRNGEEGLVVEATAERFAQALSRVLQDTKERREMGEKARQRAQQFSSARCAEQVLEVYRRAIA